MGKIHEKIGRPRQENAQATHRLMHNKKEEDSNEKKKKDEFAARMRPCIAFLQ